MRTWAKRGAPLAGAFVVALMGAAFCAAKPGTGVGPLDPIGEPKGFHKGDTVRYAIWHNDRGWHLRTTTARKERQFKGHIRVEGGVFERIHSHDLEKEGRLADWWRVGPKRHEVTFDFKTERGIDGIDFRVSKSAKRIRFDLHIDGRPEPGRVFVGNFNQHPVQNPFDLPAHP
jgi:hypothetical protein